MLFTTHHYNTGIEEEERGPEFVSRFVSYCGKDSILFQRGLVLLVLGGLGAPQGKRMLTAYYVVALNHSHTVPQTPLVF